MPAIDHKPSERPRLITIAARLAREGRGGEAIAIRDAADAISGIREVLELTKYKSRLNQLEAIRQLLKKTP